ncbi:MAG: hypothetical protein R2744_11120 [Bacteroidales bacterium]
MIESRGMSLISSHNDLNESNLDKVPGSARKPVSGMWLFLHYPMKNWQPLMDKESCRIPEPGRGEVQGDGV